MTIDFRSEVLFTVKLFPQKCCSLFARLAKNQRGCMEERGLLKLPESEWTKAKHRADVIGPLAKSSPVGRIAAEEAAAKLGISIRRVYDLVKRCRASDGLVTDLALVYSSGGKGKQRTAPEVNSIIREVIETHYLSRQKNSEALIVREVRMRCRKAGYQLPASNTVRARILSLCEINAALFSTLFATLATSGCSNPLVLLLLYLSLKLHFCSFSRSGCPNFKLRDRCAQSNSSNQGVAFITLYANISQKHVVNSAQNDTLWL